MDAIDIKIGLLEIIKFDPRESLADIRINYSSNENNKISLIRSKMDNPEEITRKIIKYLKDKERYKVEGDDILDTILIIKLFNEEKIEEKLQHFFGKYLDCVKEVKRKKSHENYINMFNSLCNQKIEFKNK